MFARRYTLTFFLKKMLNLENNFKNLKTNADKYINSMLPLQLIISHKTAKQQIKPSLEY